MKSIAQAHLYFKVFVICFLVSSSASAFIKKPKTLDEELIEKEKQITVFYEERVKELNNKLPKWLDSSTLLESAEYLGNRRLRYNYVLKLNNNIKFNYEFLKKLRKEKVDFYCAQSRKNYLFPLKTSAEYKYFNELEQEVLTIYIYHEECINKY